jgi:hypothetical protein
MAIIVEEESSKSSASLILVASWVAAIALLGAGAYYVFFANPQIIETALPSNFKNTQDISKITLRPEEVAGNPFFKSLRTPLLPAYSPKPGKPNPFAPFQ